MSEVHISVWFGKLRSDWPEPRLPAAAGHLQPRPERSLLSHESLDLRPWRHTLRPVRVSPVLTPAGDPVQIPPPPEAWPRLLLPWRRAGSWVMGSTSGWGWGSAARVSGTPSISFGRSSLEAVMGLESSSELFTISVNGVLYLQVCGAGSAVGGPPLAGRGAGGLGSCGCSAPGLQALTRVRAARSTHASPSRAKLCYWVSLPHICPVPNTCPLLCPSICFLTSQAFHAGLNRPFQENSVGQGRTATEVSSPREDSTDPWPSETVGSRRGYSHTKLRVTV